MRPWWLKKAAQKAEAVLTVCMGAFLAADAGLLDGVEATTHAWGIEGLKKAAPKCKVVADRRYVDGGRRQGGQHGGRHGGHRRGAARGGAAAGRGGGAVGGGGVDGVPARAGPAVVRTGPAESPRCAFTGRG